MGKQGDGDNLRFTRHMTQTCLCAWGVVSIRVREASALAAALSIIEVPGNLCLNINICTYLLSC